MKGLKKFTNEGLKVIEASLFRTMDDYERGVCYDEKEYKIAKGLYTAIRSFLAFRSYFQSILDEAEND